MFKLHTLLSNTGVFRSLTVAVLSFVFAMAVHAADATVTVGSNSIYASTTVAEATSIELRVAGGPNDYYATQSSDTGSVTWDAPYGLADGTYRYEVVVNIPGNGEQNDPGQQLRENGSFEVQSGTMSVPVGTMSVPLVEPPAEPPAVPGPEAASKVEYVPSFLARLAKSVLEFMIPTASAADAYVYDPTPEVFFQDSTVGGTQWSIFADQFEAAFNNLDTGRTIWYADDATQFSLIWDPSGVWGLYNGKQAVNSIVIDDDSGVDVFYADLLGDIHLANNTVFIDKSANRLGIGTTMPSQNLHVGGGQIQLDPGGTVGDWWVHPGILGLWLVNTDGTNTEPVKFGNNAPTDSLVVEGNTGRIGIGTSTPTTPLHIRRADANLFVQNTTGTTAERVLFKLQNNGKTRFEIVNGADSWTFDNDGFYFNISKVGTGANEFRVSGAGDVFARGSYFSSSREIKKDFLALDEREVLNKLASLPVTEWKYKQDGSRHFGPVAEEFQETFGLGDGKHISVVDTAGVTMAAIQGLYQVVQDKDKEISALREEKNAELEALKAENRALAERLQVLEKLILYKEVALVQ